MPTAPAANEKFRRHRRRRHKHWVCRSTAKPKRGGGKLFLPMDALNDKRNRNGKEAINKTNCEDTTLFAITIAP